MQKGASLAAVLRQLQSDQGLGTSDLAEAAGVEVSTMRSVLSGEITCPPMARIEAWAQALNVSIGELRRAAERDGCSFENQRGEAAAPVTISGKAQQALAALKSARSTMTGEGDA